MPGADIDPEHAEEDWPALVENGMAHGADAGLINGLQEVHDNASDEAFASGTLREQMEAMVETLEG